MIVDFESYLVEVSTDTDATPEDASALPEAVDDRLYMSQVYHGKTLDDIYSMLVSARNAVLLLCFIKCTLCQGHYDFSFSDFYFIFVCCVEASK